MERRSLGNLSREIEHERTRWRELRRKENMMCAGLMAGHIRRVFDPNAEPHPLSVRQRCGDAARYINSRNWLERPLSTDEASDAFYRLWRLEADLSDRELEICRAALRHVLVRSPLMLDSALRRKAGNAAQDLNRLGVYGTVLPMDLWPLYFKLIKEALDSMESSLERTVVRA